MKHALLIALASLGPLTALASPATDQANALLATDFPSAIAVLEKADAAGDREASSQLGSVLFFSPAPRMDRRRACAIAERLASVDHGDGWSLLASCQMAGAIQSVDRIADARTSARKAILLGAANGGTMLFSVFTIDPRFSYRTAEGKVDAAKYAALAALPLEARELQIEAWSALSMALERRDPMASMFAIAALSDSSAPGNLGRLLDIAERSPTAARQFPAFVNAARQLANLGGTHASVKSAIDAHKSALSAAMFGSVASGGTACRTMALVKIDAGAAPADLKFLPVPVGPLSNAYLLAGQWQERWTYSGCGVQSQVALAFRADGWGGTYFNAQLVRPNPAAETAPQ